MDELLIRCASPTLASLKVGNLICYRSQNKQEVLQFLTEWNTRLEPKGVSVTLLSEQSNLYLIYIYRKHMLTRVTAFRQASILLEQFGYAVHDPESLVDHLKKRLKISATFPHEIGLFLGYPAEDVKAFIEQRGCNGKCDGCWKVYTDELQAKRIFSQFKKCTRIYLELYEKGKSIEELTVRRRAG